MDSLSNLMGMISRFWISNALVTQDEMPVEQKIRQSIGLIASILGKYATGKGRKEIMEYFKG